MTKPGWEEWEYEVQQRLGLDATICSGNKFQDVGDATDNSNPRDKGFRLLVDCKYTEKGSFSVKRETMQQWILRGVERGKMAIMAIRIWPRGMAHEADYVVLRMDDFEELLEKSKVLTCSGCGADMKRVPCHHGDVPSPNFSGWTAPAIDRTYLDVDEYRRGL